MSLDTLYWIAAGVAVLFCLPLRRLQTGLMLGVHFIARLIAILGVGGLGFYAAFPDLANSIHVSVPEAWLGLMTEWRPHLPSPAQLSATLGLGGLAVALAIDFVRTLMNQKTEMRTLGLLLRQHHHVLLQARKVATMPSPASNGHMPAPVYVPAETSATPKRRLGEIFLTQD